MHYVEWDDVYVGVQIIHFAAPDRAPLHLEKGQKGMTLGKRGDLIGLPIVADASIDRLVANWRSFEVAAFPTWSIKSPHLSWHAELKALKAIEIEQNKNVENLCSAFRRHYRVLPKYCYIPEVVSLTALPADSPPLRRGVIYYKEIGMIAVG